MVTELQQFPVLQKCMDDVIGFFLRECKRPTDEMIKHHIETQVISVMVFVCRSFCTLKH